MVKKLPLEIQTLPGKSNDIMPMQRAELWEGPSNSTRYKLSEENLGEWDPGLGSAVTGLIKRKFHTEAKVQELIHATQTIARFIKEQPGWITALCKVCLSILNILHSSEKSMDKRL